MMLPFSISRVSSFLCLLGVVLILLSSKVSSTPIGNFCVNTSTYTPNSAYKSNIDFLLSVLSSNASTAANGFYNFTAGPNSPDAVYGLFLCRGDVSPSACGDCVATASSEIVQFCPKEKWATLYYDDCLLRYSNQNIFSVMDQTKPHAMSNPLYNTNIDPKRFREVLGEIMNDAAAGAAAANDVESSGKKFATKEGYVSGRTLYGLAQCTPDISTEICTRCLEDAISGLPVCCNKKQGGRYLYPSCNIRYELYKFYHTESNLSAPPPPPPGPAKKGKVPVAVIVPVGVAVLLFFVGICFLCRKAKKKYGTTKEDSTVGNEITIRESLQYDLATIQAATNNFSDENVIGKGGFGDVYKGIFSNGEKLAVKRLSRNSGQGVEEFKNEIVLVAKLQHRNLVRLLGFCSEGEEKILIYEFVPNKSLDYLLFDPREQKKLDWSRRYKIITGIARGMLYLHEESQLKIIHRDFKASNILLDKDMNAKISDFGIAKLFGVDQSKGNTNRVVGTFGYMSPEYVMHGHFSIKSDVFSFGVLLLEIISGKKNANFYKPDSSEDLLSYAWKLWRDGTPMELMDPALEGSYSRNEVIRCIQIGLLCVQEDPNARPSTVTVVLMLDSYSATVSVPQQPAFFSHTRSGFNKLQGLNSDESSSKLVPFSVNEVTITKPYPR